MSKTVGGDPVRGPGPGSPRWYVPVRTGETATGKRGSGNGFTQSYHALYAPLSDARHKTGPIHRAHGPTERDRYTDLSPS
ncbi:hypothetical protein SSPS47_15935 [Streptomyces sp. S4.7]|nr:hypothetical protein SSPS47_15935 [Streptomyces sp. S4.7]